MSGTNLGSIPGAAPNALSDSSRTSLASTSTAAGSKATDEQSLYLFYNAFRQFLNIESAYAEANSRRNQSGRAQQKLRRLSPQQFHELSTDVHDELLRRLNSNVDSNDASASFLQPRDNFHPKRNQARQKLSLLSPARFNDLSFDILYEIERRLNKHPASPVASTHRQPASIPPSPITSIAPSFSDAASVQGQQPNSFYNTNSTYPNHASSSPNSSNAGFRNHAHTASQASTLPSPATQDPNSLGMNKSALTPATPSTPAVFGFLPSPEISSPMSPNIQTHITNTDSAFSAQHHEDHTNHEVKRQHSLTDLKHPESLEGHLSPAPKPQQLVPTVPMTTTITPQKSTLVESDSEDDGTTGTALERGNGAADRLDHDDDDEYSEVDDNPENDVFPGGPLYNQQSNTSIHDTGSGNSSSHDVVMAAAKAWANKNSSTTDLHSLRGGVSGSTVGAADATGYSHGSDDGTSDLDMTRPLESTTPTDHTSPPIGELKPQQQQQQQQQQQYLDPQQQQQQQYQMNNGFFESESDLQRALPLQSIQEERSPYIPPGLFAHSGSSASGDRRRSLSEQISSSIGGGVRSRSVSKHDLELSSSKYEQEIQTLKSHVDKATAESAKLNDKIKDRDEQIQMLVDEGSRMDENITKLEKQLADAESLKASLVDENGRLHQVVGALEENKDKLAGELEEARREISTKTEEYITELEDKQRAFASLEIQHQKLKEKHTETMSKQSEFAGSSASLSSQIMLLEGKRLQLESTITTLREELETSHAELAAKDAKIEELTHQANGVRDIGNDSPSVRNLLPAAEIGGGRSREVSESSNGKYVALLDENESLKEQYGQLQSELEQQQIVTDQVRREASAFLEEMRTLAESEGSWASSEKHAREIETLKREVSEWKARYSKAKSQVRNLRSSTYGSGSGKVTAFPHQQVAMGSVDASYVSPTGRILDVNVTKFQVAMDDFLLKTRTTPPKQLMDHLHNLVQATRLISQDVTSADASSNDTNDLAANGGSSNKGTEKSSSNSRGTDALQAELAQATSVVSATATHLITTTRNHAIAGGISPMFLLDAAATDLSASVIDLIRLAKVKPSPAGAIGASGSLSSITTNLTEQSEHDLAATGLGQSPSQSQRSDKTPYIGHSKSHNRTHSRTHSRSHSISSSTGLQTPALVSSASMTSTVPQGIPASNSMQFAQTSPTSANTSRTASYSRQHTAAVSQTSPGYSHHRQASSNNNSSGSNQVNYSTPSGDKYSNGTAPSSPLFSKQQPADQSFDYTTSEISPMKAPASENRRAAEDQHHYQHHSRTASGSGHYQSPSMSSFGNLPTTSTPKSTHHTSHRNVIMVDPEKKTVGELQVYLETQTASVIDSIQQLLTGIKGSSNYAEVRHSIYETISTVKPVIDATSRSMTQTRNWRLRDLGKYIVDSLESCCERMGALSLDSSVFDENLIPDKQFKQRLAGISFDMARCTKELVKTVEEVSLKFEINELDQEIEKVK